MTAPRLCITRLPAAAVSFDDQARQLLAELTPSAPVWAVSDVAAAWRLAEFIDLVDAGYGKRDALYRSASQALSQFTRANWSDTACRAMCGRSAFLSNLVEQGLSDRAHGITVADKPRAAA